MILAGVDEAGYGPLLGPLVVGCCAFQIDEPGDELLPCLWTRLRRSVSKKRVANGKKLHINDSKVVYSPADGLKELERAVLALAASLHGSCDDLDTLLATVASHVLPDLRTYSWYVPGADETFPMTHEAVAVRIQTNALMAEMRRAGASCVHLAARVVCERQLNRMLAATRNKASVLFSTAAIHLDYLIRTLGHQSLTIVCDRQGGREHYGSLLRLMFDEWSLQVIRESEGRSEYCLLRGPDTVRLMFWEKAEMQCLSTAAASMLSKYLREALMRRFNAFWLSHLPGVTPTAGYYTDGSRFLRDIEQKRRELGIGDEEFIRQR